MKLKELYIANQRYRYSSIKGIKKENLKLEMRPLRKIKENIVGLLIILVLIIGLLLVNFNLKYFTVSLSLILFFVAVFLFGNKAILQCDKNTLNIKQGFQQLNIPYKNLKNVYIGKVSRIIIFSSGL